MSAQSLTALSTRERSDSAWLDWEAWAWPLKQDVVQSSPLVCSFARGSSELGVVRLTHTCMRVVQREAALLTQPCMVVGPVKQWVREIQTGMLFLSSATCVSVTAGFVPPQSLTHVDYLYLRQKANTSHILWASNQTLKHNISSALWAESSKDLLPVWLL